MRVASKADSQKIILKLKSDFEKGFGVRERLVFYKSLSFAQGLGVTEYIIAIATNLVTLWCAA